MERFNPFAAEDSDPFSVSPVRSQKRPSVEKSAPDVTAEQESSARPSKPALVSRYSTSFPDPFGDEQPVDVCTVEKETTTTTTTKSAKIPETTASSVSPGTPISSSAMSNRSNSVTFLAGEQTSGRPASNSATRGRQAGGAGSGFTSFLSRATSVTSSTVTDRVTGAVGTVRSAVDSLSSQIQQAVPSSVMTSGGSGSSEAMQQAQQQQQQQQQSTASYLASKLSSATNQFTSAGQSGQSMPVISRQRVVLVLDQTSRIDWPNQFQQYKRLIAGLAPLPQTTSGGGGLSSFFSSQFAASAAAAMSSAVSSSSSSSLATPSDASDLIEQVNFGDISVLANQSSATAAVYVAGSSGFNSNHLAMSMNSSNSPVITTTTTAARAAQQQPLAPPSSANKIIRPEYVVVRERVFKYKREHLRSIVKGLSYSSVPMFEPYEIWDTFQDRQLVFARLLRVQKALGKENFPLIPQIYCQTYQDLLNYINYSSVTFPCLVRTGHLGKGKIRCDSMETLRDLVSIMATSEQSCTIEPFLEVKHDLIVQRLGTSLKLFKRNATQSNNNATTTNSANTQQRNTDDPYQTNGIASSSSSSSTPMKQSATRQTSLGAGVLSNLMGSSSSSQQQQHQQHQELSRVNSAAGAGSSSLEAFEKLSEVGVRYRSWAQAISREFDNRLDVMCIKIVVASNDREYIVGLQNCSMDFVGSPDNQEEDRRSFVELIISKMNTILPKHHQQQQQQHSAVGRETSSEQQQQQVGSNSLVRRISGEGQQAALDPKRPSMGSTFMSQSEMNSTASSLRRNEASSRSYGQLNNRSKSVSINKADFGGSGGRMAATTSSTTTSNKSSAFQLPARRGSERSDSHTELTSDVETLNGDVGGGAATIGQSQPTANTGGLHQRQASLGQSFLDQTSTAFSSFQRQSLSFFKRLDAMSDHQQASSMGAQTPPQSAKSDTNAFEAGDWLMGGGGGGHQPQPDADSGSQRNGGYSKPNTKSQSMDSSGVTGLDSINRSPSRPPKPPPPAAQSMMNRQSSLASYSSTRPHSNYQPHQHHHQYQHQYQPQQQHQRAYDATTTPNTTPTQTRQNSAIASQDPIDATSEGSKNGGGQTTATTTSRSRVIRQNSALSAFEPFDLELKTEVRRETIASGQPQLQQQQLASSADADNKTTTITTTTTKLKTNNNSDTASMTSGDSNSTNETTTAEDTMNNLKKTFASIFGDKCE